MSVSFEDLILQALLLIHFYYISMRKYRDTDSVYQQNPLMSVEWTLQQPMKLTFMLVVWSFLSHSAKYIFNVVKDITLINWL